MYESVKWVIIASGNGLLPVLPEPMPTKDSKKLVYFGMKFEMKWRFGLPTTSLDQEFKPMFFGCVDSYPDQAL